MEKKLGRKLNSSEIIHHKDGNSHNNNPENLELTNNKNHNNLPHLDPKEWEKIVIEMIEEDESFRGIKLNEHLNAFFTNRQKEIIFRRLKKLPLSKTETEYYSRTIKKKIKALTNANLIKLANILIE